MHATSFPIPENPRFQTKKYSITPPFSPRLHHVRLVNRNPQKHSAQLPESFRGVRSRVEAREERGGRRGCKTGAKMGVAVRGGLARALAGGGGGGERKKNRHRESGQETTPEAAHISAYIRIYPYSRAYPPHRRGPRRPRTPRPGPPRTGGRGSRRRRRPCFCCVVFFGGGKWAHHGDARKYTYDLKTEVRMIIESARIACVVEKFWLGAHVGRERDETDCGRHTANRGEKNNNTLRAWAAG